MRAKLERVVLGLLLASAMMLGGCIAQSGDDVGDEDALVEETQEALEVEDAAAGDPTDVDLPARGGGSAAEVPSTFGDDCTSDPQPNPWVPTAMMKGPPRGPSDPGPTLGNR